MVNHRTRHQLSWQSATPEHKPAGGIVAVTVAEFGDKTQIAVVALSSTAAPTAVWLGSTLALVSTSALGVLAGRTIFQKIPLALLHKISGSIFLALASIAAYRAYISYLPSDV